MPDPDQFKGPDPKVEQENGQALGDTVAVLLDSASVIDGKHTGITTNSDVLERTMLSMAGVKVTPDYPVAAHTEISHQTPGQMSMDIQGLTPADQQKFKTFLEKNMDSGPTLFRTSDGGMSGSSATVTYFKISDLDKIITKVGDHLHDLGESNPDLIRSLQTQSGVAPNYSSPAETPGVSAQQIKLANDEFKQVISDHEQDMDEKSGRNAIDRHDDMVSLRNRLDEVEEHLKIAGFDMSDPAGREKAFATLGTTSEAFAETKQGILVTSAQKMFEDSSKLESQGNRFRALSGVEQAGSYLKASGFNMDNSATYSVLGTTKAGYDSRQAALLNPAAAAPAPQQQAPNVKGPAQ